MMSLKFRSRNLAHSVGGKTGMSADEFSELCRKLSLSTLLLGRSV